MMHTDVIITELKAFNDTIKGLTEDIIDNYGGICIHTKKDGNYIGTNIDGEKAIDGNSFTQNDLYKNTAYIHVKGTGYNPKMLAYALVVELVLMTSIQRAGRNFKTFEDAVEIHKRIFKKVKNGTLNTDVPQPELHELSFMQFELLIYPPCANGTTPTCAPC